MASKHHKLFWGSSYDRGLQYLLYIWPDIKLAYPDAELHICYGWDLFLKVQSGNPERMQWMESMNTLMQQKDIIHHGRVGKGDLEIIRNKCGIWAYPTDFREINCITALDCQKSGVVPVVINLAALEETVGVGVKVKGDIKDTAVQQEYLKELLSLMGDEERWKKLSKEGKEFAKKYEWKDIAKEWTKYFKEPISNPLVSVLTPTIREGFWRIMSENLANQTYKNFEWIILDDYKIDRSALADKYAKKYNLNIRYLRGDRSLGLYKRKCGLVRANNKSIENAKGELLVWVQDFVLIPDNGIEMLVDLYRRNPDALLAPVDIYYDVSHFDKLNKEDWWNGSNLELKKAWSNIRVLNKGITESDNPADFELNYGAIPKKILDDLNGFWEFMDDGLGFDNTEIAYRALKKGYRLIIDDTNIAKCINIWPIVGGTSQNILSRDRMLNPPRYKWLITKTDLGELPVVRDKKRDETITLPFEVPKEIEDKDCPKWINKNIKLFLEKWD